MTYQSFFLRKVTFMPSHLRIRQRRIELGLSQVALAKLLKPWFPGIDDSDISRIETGKRAVRADEIPAFSKVLKCDIQDLIDPIP
jgi:transcriptional regulator with XRE-family HTH domain